MTTRITGCSMPGCWWEKFIGCTITIIHTDHYGHWTRDTGPMRCIQWIKIADTCPTFGGVN